MPATLCRRFAGARPAAALLLTVGTIQLACSGGAVQQPAKPPPAKAGSGAQPHQQPRIVGQIERLPQDPQRRKMVIWGKVQRIIEGKHAELPKAQPVSEGGVGDPITEIRNNTPYPLTVWFAGACAHHTDVPQGQRVTAAFCPGVYNIAAVVKDPAYLPLVREKQAFEGGVSYVLQVVIRQHPTR